MTKKFHDFDAQFSEMNAERIPFRAFGKMYSIRKAMPATLVLEMARHEDGEELSTRFMFKCAEQIFGREVLDELCENPEFTADRMSQMIKWAFEAINGKAELESVEQTEDDTATAAHEKN